MKPPRRRSCCDVGPSTTCVHSDFRKSELFLLWGRFGWFESESRGYAFRYRTAAPAQADRSTWLESLRFKGNKSVVGVVGGFNFGEDGFTHHEHWAKGRGRDGAVRDHQEFDGGIHIRQSRLEVTAPGREPRSPG